MQRAAGAMLDASAWARILRPFRYLGPSHKRIAQRFGAVAKAFAIAPGDGLTT
jgi:hypothetical protein